jgi:hypothetical protein
MRQVKDSESYKPVGWVAMRHQADCWIAACAMAVGVTYEEAEEYFGPGEEYSSRLLDSDDPHQRFAMNWMNMLSQTAFFTSQGYYPLFLCEINPKVELGRRYLLASRADDPQHPSMAHTFVVDESGKLFDPDPQFGPADPKYRIENYPEIIGWEIVRL